MVRGRVVWIPGIPENERDCYPLNPKPPTQTTSWDEKLGFVAWEFIHLKERLRLQMFRQDVAEETHEEEAEATEGTKDVAGVSSW